MDERSKIVSMWRNGAGAGLVTLIAAAGSSYRRPGARMLVGGAGEFVGSISGGCLEAELARRMSWLVRDGAVIRRVSTQIEDNDEMPFGLGCGGVLDLLLEPVGTAEFEALADAMQRSLDGEASQVFTWLPLQGAPLRRMVVDAGGQIAFGSATLGGEERRRVREWFGSEPHRDETLFVERLEAPQRLIVIGAGEDARSLVAFAALLGWRISVFDGRRQLARAERFPEAVRVEVIPSAEFSRIDVRPADAVVVMTHSYEQDRDAIFAFLRRRPRYLGLLGARHRSARILQEAALQTGTTLEACCEAVRAPIGLDLGGDGADAIALAIVAEVQACCTGKPSGPLRLSAASIGHYALREQEGPPETGTCAMEIGG